MKHNTLLITAIVAAVTTLSGCASVTNYRPVVDTYGDPRAAFLSQDSYECEQLASENSGAAKGAATDGLAGALLGGAAGAVGGAFLGNPGMGAAVGASAGALGGVAKGAIEGDETYKRIYRNCMRGRGHRVLD
jgi:outer membrane lipoprotein SlyB